MQSGKSESKDVFFKPIDLTGKFPLYPEEGMDYLFKRLEGKIKVEKIGRVYLITPKDKSITVKGVEGEAFQYHNLFLNGETIATTIPIGGKTTMHLDELVKQLDHPEEIDFDFFSV